MVATPLPLKYQWYQITGHIHYLTINLLSANVDSLRNHYNNYSPDHLVYFRIH